jgi:non-specific serine/threonine protein kinase/NIMA (never in mitosis gene a)-related kinase
MTEQIVKIEELEAELGSGTYGAVNVYRETQAYKSFYRRDLSKYDEISVLRSIDHPNIVAFHGLGVHNDKVGIIMELCEMTLDDYLSLPIVSINGLDEDYGPFITREVDGVKGRPPFRHEHYLDACHQLLSGIACLHEVKITHADIKGNNVMIKDGRLVIGDFGLAIQCHASGKRDINICATIEWRPLDIIYLARNGEYGKIIPNGSDRMTEWCEKVSEHYYDVIELYQVDIYSIGLIILSILIGKPQPHSPLDQQDMYGLLGSWHRNCSTRSLQTIRNYLRRMEGWPAVSDMADFLSRMVASSPWNRYHTVGEALTHKIFTTNGYNEPIRGIHHINKWRRDESIPTLNTKIIKRACSIFGSIKPISSISSGLLCEGIIYLIGYLHYIHELRVKNNKPDFYQFNSKIDTDDFLINTAISMTRVSIYGNHNLESEAIKNKYPTMFDDYAILSNGRMFLEAEWSTSSASRLSPLGFYLQPNYLYETLTEYIMATERSLIRQPYLAISRKYHLSDINTKLNIGLYHKLVDDIIATIQ